MPELRYDLAIVGGGPGGMAAAATAADHGLRVAVLDEQEIPGGQIYRRPFAEGLFPADRFGRDYQEAGPALRAIAMREGVTWIGGASVFGLQQRGEAAFAVLWNTVDRVSKLLAERVLVAAGCFDMAVPFPGWTLPGVMGAGGMQALLKGQGVLPGGRIVLAGSHPLLLVIAAQLVAFDQPPLAVILTQSPTRAGIGMRAPVTALRNIGVFREGLIACHTLRRVGVPIHFGHVVTEARGGDRLESIGFRPVAGGALRDITCDTLGVGYGFTASTELIRQVGAPCRWSRAGGGWIAEHDEDMRTAVPGVFVAGEVAGIGGAPTARAEGALAALSIARDAGRRVDAGRVRRARGERARRRRFAALLERLADPGDDVLRTLRDSDTALCRCENVSVGDFRATLAANPTIRSADAAKLLTRTGMGPCQGRFCHRAVMEEIGALRAIPAESAGAFHARMPVRPVPLAAMAAFHPADDTD
jgi:thioredoxin reductase